MTPDEHQAPTPGSYRDEAWREEMQSAFLYDVMAEAEPSANARALFEGLASAARRQAAVWAAAARAVGHEVSGHYRPGARTRLVAWLVRRLGPRRLRPVLSAMKVRGLSVYDGPALGHAMPRSVAEVGRRHRSPGVASNLRAAVFGANDGLVSNASLVLGVAAAAGSSGDSQVMVAGVAGLLAGALSMAAGEYISVRSQREMFEHQIGLERDELAQYPDEEAEELALIYQARGLPAEQARQLGHQLVSSPDRALDALAREELGLDPDALVSPWGAALYSFLSFASGALLPLLPFLILDRSRALGWMLGVTGAALFLVGSSISLFTGRSALIGGLRMLIVGGAAGSAAYAIGMLMGRVIG